MWLVALEHIRWARAAAAAQAAGVARPVTVGPGEPPDTDWPAPRTTTVVGSMRQRSAASMARSNAHDPSASDVHAVTHLDDAMLFRRSEANPILTVADVPYPANSVFNPGAARVGDETILLVRVEDLRGISQLHVVRSADGVTGWTFDPEPLLRSDAENHPEEIWGCEDPRLTWLPEREEWAIAYTAYSRRGPLVSLAMTRDFRSVTRLGPVMPPEDKDAALFPRPVRRPLGDDPSALAAARQRPHVALVRRPTCGTGATTRCCSRRARARGGMPARSASARRRSRPTRAGW